MIFVISPAKALDFDTPPVTSTHTQPEFVDQAATLIALLRKLAPADVAKLMKLSDTLASLNVARYESWSPVFTLDNAKQAVLAFNGDVYGGLDAATLSEAELGWAQRHLRILSGLYGVLRPLDLMQPYRLEMGSRLANPRGSNLYAYWGDTLTRKLNTLLDAERERTGATALVNLASEEYFKTVQPAGLHAPVITPVFEDWKGGGYKIISFYAKRARGLMCRHAIRNRVDSIEGLLDFDAEGYRYVAATSDESRPVFRRRLD
jgi:cytoplasmic iron level regulating protein YaaA (DUF328/UPF0246 family)